MGIVRIGHREVIGPLSQRLEALSAEGWASRVAMLIETDQESEEYAWLGMAPKVREWVGGRMPDKLRETSFSIKNKLFEASKSLFLMEKLVSRSLSGILPPTPSRTFGAIPSQAYSSLSWSVSISIATRLAQPSAERASSRWDKGPIRSEER